MIEMALMVWRIQAGGLILKSGRFIQTCIKLEWRFIKSEFSHRFNRTVRGKLISTAFPGLLPSVFSHFFHKANCLKHSI